MKKLLVILLMLQCAWVFPQEKNNQYSGLKELYRVAIESQINKEQEYIQKGISTLKIENLYFISKYVSVEYLPKTIGEYTLNYLNVYHKKNKKLLRKGIYAFSIQPIELKGNVIRINLIEFRISYKNNNYYFSNGGGSTTIFEYSCQNNSWALKGTKFKGI